MTADDLIWKRRELAQQIEKDEANLAKGREELAAVERQLKEILSDLPEGAVITYHAGSVQLDYDGVLREVRVFDAFNIPDASDLAPVATEDSPL